MLREKQLENAREQFETPLCILAFNVAFVKADKSHATSPIRVRSGQVAVAWKPSK